MGLPEDNRAAGEAEGESFHHLFARLVGDAVALIRAEVDLYRNLALQRLVGSRAVVLLAGGGLLLILGAVTAFLVGLVLALAPLITALGAAFAVGLAGVAAGLLLLRLAVRRFQHIGDELEGEEG